MDELPATAGQDTVEAIASALNQSLQAWNIETRVTVTSDTVDVTLITPPECESLAIATAVQQSIKALNLAEIEYLSLNWQLQGETTPIWQQEIDLASVDSSLEPEPELEKSKTWGWGAIAGKLGKLTDASKTVTQAAVQTGKNITETASELGNAIAKTTSQTAEQASQALTKATTEASGVLEQTKTHAQNLFSETTNALGSAIDTTGKTVAAVGTSTAAQAQTLLSGATTVVSSAVDTTGKTVAGVGNAVGNTANQAKQTLSQAAQFVAESPLLEQIINHVDLVKAEEALERLQAKHPNETPAQISHRLMLEKAIYAGGTGLATSIVPGAIAALIAVDLAAVATLQAEMVYQISGAYGLDLRASERKSEVLAIFGLALGSGHAVRAGVTLLQATPVLGAAIGASSNAAMIYAVGYAACRFYEAKLQENSSEIAAIASAQASEAVLEDAIAQETAMDRVIVQLLRAGYPEKTWAELKPELEAANLSLASLEAIEAHFDAPESLDTLLNQISPDFAVPLLVQGQKIAQLDGIVNAEEAAILEQIRQTFQIDLAALLESQTT